MPWLIPARPALARPLNPGPPAAPYTPCGHRHSFPPPPTPLRQLLDPQLPGNYFLHSQLPPPTSLSSSSSGFSSAPRVPTPPTLSSGIPPRAGPAWALSKLPPPTPPPPLCSPRATLDTEHAQYAAPARSRRVKAVGQPGPRGRIPVLRVSMTAESQRRTSGLEEACAGRGRGTLVPCGAEMLANYWGGGGCLWSVCDSQCNNSET